LPEGSERSGLFILSISISKISLITFPAEAVKPEENPASNAILKEKLSTEQRKTATTAVKNVIIKFMGRRIFR
jgi:hypothetical protein